MCGEKGDIGSKLSWLPLLRMIKLSSASHNHKEVRNKMKFRNNYKISFQTFSVTYDNKIREIFSLFQTQSLKYVCCAIYNTSRYKIRSYIYLISAL